MALISPTSDQPGSPYRASSGSGSGSSMGNGSATKASLSKDLMHKLRSMTETIKVLSDENAKLKSEKEEILKLREFEKSKSANGKDFD